MGDTPFYSIYVNLKCLIYPSPLSSLVTVSLFSMSDLIFVYDAK